MRRLMVLTAIVALAWACGGDEEAPAKGAKGQSFSVRVDGETDKFNGMFSAFFPSQLAVHPGDTVSFELPHFNGEHHAVAFGTLVDAAVAKLEQLGPTASLETQENTPEMLKLPDVFLHALPPDELDEWEANQSAAQPCFLTTGEPPVSLTGSAPACPKAEQPAFDGTQAFFSSGAGQFFEDGDSFEVNLADSIKPGAYSFLCLIHRGAMTGKLTVVDDGQRIPSPKEVAANGEEQLDRLVSQLEPVVAGVKGLTPDLAAAGAGSPTILNAWVAEFAPKTMSIQVGGSVTWSVFGYHSVTLNATERDIGSLERASDGTVRLNQRTDRAGFDTPYEVFLWPPPDNGGPIAIDGGSWDGAGFKSTGIVTSLPPVLISVTQTFTKAGTYELRCQLHPDMKGEVKVG